MLLVLNPSQYADRADWQTVADHHSPESSGRRVLSPARFNLGLGYQMRRRFFSLTCCLRRWHAIGVLVIVCALNAASAFAQHDFVDASVVFENSVAVCDSLAEPQPVAVKSFVGTETICVAPQDEVWVVTAQRGCGRCSSVPSFEAERLVGGQWQPNSLSELASCHQSDPDHVTVMIVHGNNTNNDWALTRGMQFYDRMFGRKPNGRQAVRLVILAWESEKVLPRPCPDYQLKARRAVVVGSGVASLLNDLGGTRPILVGYSLGAQVVLSALTEMAACDAPDLVGCQQGFEVALIAPALEADFACGDLALISHNHLITETEIFINRSDRVLLAARFLNRKRCEDRSIEPSLLGMAEQGYLDPNRFHLHDVTREVRNRHSLVNYIESSTIQCRICQIVAASADQRMAQGIERVVEVPRQPESVAEVAQANPNPAEAAMESSPKR